MIPTLRSGLTTLAPIIRSRLRLNEIRWEFLQVRTEGNLVEHYGRAYNYIGQRYCTLRLLLDTKVPSMQHRVRAWSTLPADHHDYVFIYIWGTVWALSYLFFPPAATLSILTVVTIAIWTGVTAIGGIVALWGLLTRNNLIVERFGVTLLMVGPIIYTLTQITLLIWLIADPSALPASDPLDRVAVTVMGFWPFLFLNKRRRQLKFLVNSAKRTPLKSEKKFDKKK